jgi:hypothetical protein
LRGGDRNTDRQRIRPDQTPIALAPLSAQAAHQAEIAQQADRAESEADQKASVNRDVGIGRHDMSFSVRRRYYGTRDRRSQLNLTIQDLTDRFCG